MGAGAAGVTYTIRTGHALHTAAQCSGGLCCLPASGVTRNYVGDYAPSNGKALNVTYIPGPGLCASFGVSGFRPLTSHTKFIRMMIQLIECRISASVNLGPQTIALSALSRKRIASSPAACRSASVELRLRCVSRVPGPCTGASTSSHACFEDISGPPNSGKTTG